jgi:hypothetical protein
MPNSITAAALAAAILCCPVLADDVLKTKAESSNYTETSTSAEVIAFARELTARSGLVRLTGIGTSPGGKDIPMLILGRPPVSSPAELKRDERLCVYIKANIHAGEVEGKEAVLALARDIALGQRSYLLDKLVILIVPNFNPDGNDKISPQNRPYQKGPQGGVGVRYNDMNLDLNRDWMKLESPETRGAVQEVFNTWDPALVVDCHTTNGSPHREPLTYAPPMNPNCDREVTLYTSDILLPDADTRLLGDFGYESIPYGNFMDRLDPTKGWATFEHEPRYTTNYVGLRNRLSVLIETYAFAEYEIRVKSTYGFLVCLLEHCAENAESIKKLIGEADARACSRWQGLDPERDLLALEVERKPLPEPLLIRGYEMERYTDDQGRERARPTEKEVDYTVPYFGLCVAKRTEPIAAVYAFPVGMAEVAANLRRHGVQVERLTRDFQVKVKRFNLTEVNSAEHIFQGHISTTLRGEWIEAEVTLGEGTFIVRTDQPLGMLAAYLLEPESDDGLVYWNFLDRYLTQQWSRQLPPYPILKLPEPHPLPAELVSP